MSALQAAFVRHHAFQCGFCAPGVLLSAEAILRSGRRYSREELSNLLSGNVCRCTGYQPIVEAVFECQG
jgi:carbon-monoxide dehydrogenase small subunit